MPHFRSWRTASKPGSLAALRLNNILYTGLLLMASLVMRAPAAFAGVDPGLTWETIETEHFYIIYDSKHYDLGSQYATFAEQAYIADYSVFKEAPAKTVIVLDDNTDLANGFATGVPYPLIYSFPVLPTSLDSISDYGNWGLELLTHEYGHILTFQPAQGVMRPLRWLFGSIIRPNLLLPRWYHEGLAVTLETRFSHFGRLRSANFLAIPRALASKDLLYKENLARINEVGIPDWLGGMRPYLLGGLLWSEMVREKGDAIIADLTQAHARRVPFFIDGPPESFLGMDYQMVLAKTYDRTMANAKKQIAQIEAAGTYEGKRLNQDGFYSHSPAVSPDGNHLIFVAHTHNQDSLLSIIDRVPSSKDSFAKLPSRILFEADSVQKASWDASSNSFVYDAVKDFHRNFKYADLYRYDLATKKKTQLTHGLRLREPSVSVDGKTIVCIQNDGGATRLVSLNADGTDLKDLYVPEIQVRLAGPEFISSHEIIFSEKHDDGVEVFKILEFGTRNRAETFDPRNPRLRTALASYSPVHFPRRTSDGILFVSDQSGVANLYLASFDLRDAHPVSNTTTRVMTGEIDKRTHDLLYAKLDAEGPQIYAAVSSDWENVVHALPRLSPLVDNEWPKYETPTPVVEIKREPYNPWGWMYPHYWLPMYFWIPGGSYVSASTAIQDPLGKHSYALSANYDSFTARPSYFGSYVNATTPITITASGSDLHEYIYSGDFVRRNTSAVLSGSSFIAGLSNDWHAGGGLNYQQTQVLQNTYVRSGPQAFLMYEKVEKKGEEISPERGGSVLLTHTSFLPLKNQVTYDESSLRASGYFSRGLPARHALAGFLNVSYAPRLQNALLGRTTAASTYQGMLYENNYLMRGYGPGVFLGPNVYNATLEYRFPLVTQYQGFGTRPVFIKRWHGAVFADAVTLDGFYYDAQRTQYVHTTAGRYFAGFGGELRADITLFYQLPLTLVFGAYYGADRAAGGGTLFPSIGLSM